MANFYVNGAKIAAPDKFSWTRNDISSDSSGRDLAIAKMHKDVIAVKLSLECGWTCCSDSVSRDVLSKIKAETFIEFTYPDPKNGSVTKTFYTGDPTADLIGSIGGTNYWNVTINLVEQ